MSFEEVEAWFENRGFGVVAEMDDDGFWWAHLTRLRTDEVVAPRYGRGDSSDAAAIRAMRRFEVEQ